MAEIRIERKQFPMWSWILAAIIILGLILAWFYFLSPSRARSPVSRTGWTRAIPSEVRPESRGTVVTPPTAEDVNRAIGSYASFVGGNRTGPARIDHQFTADAFTRLGTALGTLGDYYQLYSVRPPVTLILHHSAELRQNPGSTQQANIVHEAAASASDALIALQQARFPNLKDSVQDVREAAQAIETNRPLLEQREALSGYFKQVAGVLQTMQPNMS